MKQWNGSEDTDWTNTINFVEDSLPGAGEDTVLLNTAQNSIEINITQPSSAKLGWIVIEKGCPISLGLSGDTPFERSCAGILHQGDENSKLFFKDGDQTTDRIIIDTDNQIDGARIDGDTVTNVDLLKGKTVLAATMANIANLTVSYRNQESDVILTMEDGVGTIGKLIQLAGTIMSRAAITTLVLSGGTFSQVKNAIINLFQGAGTCNYDVVDTLIYAILSGGLLDLNNTGVTKTITDLWILPGGHVNKNALTTISNEYLLPGGRITQEQQ